MKILFISNLYPNCLEKNRATFNKQQFKELSHHCGVKVIAQVAWTNVLSLKISSGKFLPYKEVIDDIEIYHPIYFFTPKILAPFYGFFCFISTFFTARRLIRTQQPNCIFASWAYPDGFAAIIIGRIFRLPVFIKVHGSDIHSQHSKIVNELTSWALKRARKIFSVSDDLKAIMTHMDIERKHIITIYNGVDHTKFFDVKKEIARKKFNIPLSKKVLLFIGNLETVKGPDVLLEAANLMKLNDKEIILYYVGKGRLMKVLREKCYRYGLEKYIFFLGTVDHNNMCEVLNSADLLIVPSRNEGVPNVILEAMACKTPVVATRVGGIPEVVIEGESGFLVEPENPDELAKAIDNALYKNWNYDAILNRSKNYSWDKNALVILEQIKNGIA